MNGPQNLNDSTPVLIYQPLGNVWVAIEWLAAKLVIFTITSLRRNLAKNAGDSLKPTPITDKMKLLGAAHAPEMICFPYKAILGYFIDQISSFQNLTGLKGSAGFQPLIIGHKSTGPCRERAYYRTAEIGLESLFGRNFDTYVAEESLDGVVDLVRWFSRISGRNFLSVALLINEAIERLKLIEEFEKEIRFSQSVTGDFSGLEKVLEKARNSAADVKVDTRELKHRIFEYKRDLPKMRRDIRTIAFIGEIFHIEEAMSSSCDVIRLTAKQGFFPKKEVGLDHYLDRYELSPARFFRFLLSRAAHPWEFGKRYKTKTLANLGGLTRDPGGHGLEKVAVLQEVSMAKAKGLPTYAGIIELAPAFCLPQVVAENISIPIVRKGKIPYMRLLFDEQTGMNGVYTRLEAFFDMISKQSK